MSGNLRVRHRTTRPLIALGLVVAVVAATVGVDVGGAPRAEAAGGVASQNFRGAPAYCEGTNGWPGYPVAMTTSVSNKDYAQGETVRVTFTVGSAFPKKDHEPPPPEEGEEPEDPRYSGVASIQGGWSGQEILGWSEVEGISSFQQGTSVLFRPSPLPDGTSYNNLIGPGDSFWIDYRAPDPTGRAGFDQWGGVITGFERENWSDAAPPLERVGWCPMDGVNEEPSVGFTWEQSTTDPLEVQFTNTSSDPDGGTLSYAWDFGDGTTSTEESPQHTFAEAKRYTVSLEVTDGAGASGTATQEVNLRGLLVNSTGDGAAIDVAELGCDTGGTVGDQPECTLRAAIETLNHEQSGTITFGIDGEELPTIATTAALPQITAPAAVIDGTTQTGGFVKVTAGGREEAVLDIAASDARITGLVLDQAETGFEVSGGNVTLEGNVIGTMPTGTTPGAVILGVNTTGSGTIVRDNVVAALGGVVVVGPNAVIDANHFGVSTAGGVIEGLEVAALVLGANSQVTGNTIRAEIVGVAVVTGSPELSGSGSTVSDNHIGVTSAGTPLAGQGEGVRVEGAADVTVSGNRIDHHLAEGAGVSVTGRNQIYSDDEGIGLIFPYYDNPTEQDTPITGGSVVVSDNVIGDEARGAVTSGDRSRNGVLVWADASEVTVTGNTVAGQRLAAIELHGGSGHVVTDNTVGSSLGGTPAPATTGILADATPDVLLGSAGSGNRITASDTGIEVVGDGATGTVGGNTVAVTVLEETTRGIAVDGTAGAFVVDSNTVTGSTTGIEVLSEPAQVVSNIVSDATSGIAVRTDGATVTGNTVSGATEVAVTVGSGAPGGEAPTSVESNVVTDSGTGLAVTSSNATIEANTVTGTTDLAIASSGSDVTVEANLVGVTSSSGPVVGNAGQGIVVLGGPATLTRNVIAGTVGNAIAVDPTVDAVLRGNRISGTTGAPIFAPGAPAAPTIDAAIQTTYEGALRTALLLTELPEESGTIEVFANASCADGEAEKVLEVTKTKTSGQTAKAILLKDRPNDDAFTVTFTADGSTSELSACTAIGSFPDSDGDGSPDPFDALWGGEDDPTRTVFLTDDEQLLGLGVADVDPETGFGGGRLTGAGPVDTPPGQPASVDLPYGVIGFTIEDLEPGGTTAVYLTVLDGEGPQGDDTYWKFGPQTPGAAPTWYDFSFDAEAGVGGQAMEPVDVAGFGIRRPFAVVLRDGALGDDDGGMNGSIHDPGGIARELAGGPTDPVDPTPTTDPPVMSPVTPVLGGGAGRGGAADPVTTDGSLPYTGRDDGRLLALGTLLLAAGAGVAVTARFRTRRRWAHRA